MIEVELTDKSFLTINPMLIVSIKSNKTREVTNARTGVKYNVNDYLSGTEFTLTMVGGSTITITKLGLDILRKQQTRGDFDPNMLHSVMRGL